MSTRRGFTILELILAAGIGSMVLVSGAVLFSVMDRSDTAARRRFEASSEMQRTRLIMQRAFSQMLMSDEQKPLKQTDGTNDAAKASAAASKAQDAANDAGTAMSDKLCVRACPVVGHHRARRCRPRGSRPSTARNPPPTT